MGIKGKNRTKVARKKNLIFFPIEILLSFSSAFKI